MKSRILSSSKSTVSTGIDGPSNHALGLTLIRRASLIFSILALIVLSGCEECHTRYDHAAQGCNCGSLALPLYYCNGMQYYEIGNRYCYFSEGKTFFVNQLPAGGHYYRWAQPHPETCGGNSCYYNGSRSGNYCTSDYTAKDYHAPIKTHVPPDDNDNR